MSDRKFSNDRHALHTGLLLGWLLRANVDARPVVDGDDCTNEIAINYGGDEIRVKVLR